MERADYRKAVRDIIRRARRAGGDLSQAELGVRLAEELGGQPASHKNLIADWERGARSPRAEAFLAVLATTNYSLDRYMKRTWGLDAVGDTAEEQIEALMERLANVEKPPEQRRGDAETAERIEKVERELKAIRGEILNVLRTLSARRPRGA